jgi:hypothetical protein
LDAEAQQRVPEEFFLQCFVNRPDALKLSYFFLQLDSFNKKSDN